MKAADKKSGEAVRVPARGVDGSAAAGIPPRTAKIRTVGGQGAGGAAGAAATGPRVEEPANWEDHLLGSALAPDEQVDPARAAELDGFSNRELMVQFLRNIGEDPAREGLLRTPFRVEKAWEFITQGYRTEPGDFLNRAIFESTVDEMVLVKDIQFYSMCEHHMLPFTGVAHVAYLPAGRVVGLSKLPRIVEMFARRLQIQERMTMQIAECVASVVQPRGVAVVIEAAHFCMMMRGVQKQQSKTVTSAMLGDFRTNAQTRDELLRLIHSSSPVG